LDKNERKMPKIADSKKGKVGIEKIRFKILQAARQEYPDLDEKTVREIAARRTNAWINFLNHPEEIPYYFSFFKVVGELSNLKIQDVTVKYFAEPSIILECTFKGTRGSSYLDYDEALEESDFATKNNVSGAEKLRDTMERLEMEMIDTRKVRKVGNSLVISIPESIINLFGLSKGDYLSFVYRFGEVKLKKEKASLMLE
jgi:hypothetical protein